FASGSRLDSTAKVTVTEQPGRGARRKSAWRTVSGGFPDPRGYGAGDRHGHDRIAVGRGSDRQRGARALFGERPRDGSGGGGGGVGRRSDRGDSVHRTACVDRGTRSGGSGCATKPGGRGRVADCVDSRWTNRECVDHPREMTAPRSAIAGRSI